MREVDPQEITHGFCNQEASTDAGCGAVVNNFTGLSEAFRVLSLPEHAKKLSEDDGNDQIVEQAEISAVVLAKSGVYPRWARCKKVCVVCRQRCGEVGHHGR